MTKIKSWKSEISNPVCLKKCLPQNLRITSTITTSTLQTIVGYHTTSIPWCTMIKLLSGKLMAMVQQGSLVVTRETHNPRDLWHTLTQTIHFSKHISLCSIDGNATIITRDPAFQDVIGQRSGFSVGDVTKLSRMYECCEYRLGQSIVHKVGYLSLPNTISRIGSQIISLYCSWYMKCKPGVGRQYDTISDTYLH